MTKKTKLPPIRKNVLESNRKKMRALYIRGYKIAKVPMVFFTRKSANAAKKNSRMQQKNKDKLSLRKLQSVYTGKDIFIFVKKP